jgi:hypothetical protein
MHLPSLHDVIHTKHLKILSYCIFINVQIRNDQHDWISSMISLKTYTQSILFKFERNNNATYHMHLTDIQEEE